MLFKTWISFFCWTQNKIDFHSIFYSSMKVSGTSNKELVHLALLFFPSYMILFEQTYYPFLGCSLPYQLSTTVLYPNSRNNHENIWSGTGPYRDLWRGRCSKYKRGTWNTPFNRAVLFADVCIKMDASVLLQQQMPWRRFAKETQNRKEHFTFKC